MRIPDLIAIVRGMPEWEQSPTAKLVVIALALIGDDEIRTTPELAADCSMSVERFNCTYRNLVSRGWIDSETDENGARYFSINYAAMRPHLEARERERALREFEKSAPPGAETRTH